MLLPNELFIHVFENLDYKSLLACLQVSTNFKSMIDGTASLQYIIELAVSGQKDGYFDPTISSGDRLTLLRKHQDAWKKLSWSRELEIPMTDGESWELFGGILAQNNERDELIFHQLPSDLRGIEEKTWTLGPDLGCTVNDFGMDPNQDLLVITEGPGADPNAEATDGYHIYLRSLTTGKPHPLAMNVMLTIIQAGEFADGDISYTIQIFGDLVAILFEPTMIYEKQVVVFEWKTGRLLLNTYSEDMDAFSLLSYRYLALGVSDDDGCPQLLVVDLTKESSECELFFNLNSGEYFAYPPLGEETELEAIQIRADPGPLCGDHKKVPFYQDSKDFILVMNMLIVEAGVAKHLIHFISAQYLISVIESSTKISPTPYSWIPQNSRMYIAPIREEPNVWVCYVYGTRYITSAQPLAVSLGKGDLPIRLYDFNTLALRRDAQMSATSELSGSVVSSANKFDSGHPFRADAETTLPYWTNIAHLDIGKDHDQHCRVMCCEDNIVIVDLESRMYRVLVF